MSVPVITPFVLGDFQTNCYVVTVPPAPQCWIVDCGYAPDALFAHIETHALEPVAPAAHPRALRPHGGRRRGSHAFPRHPRLAAPRRARFLTEPMLNLSMMLGQPVTAAPADHPLDDGTTLELNGTTWRVIHAPGHSPGSVLFVHDASNQAIVGDTLFAGSIGRHDFPTSDVDALRHTIRSVLMDLPDATTIHPGHGPKTTIGTERATNPFVRHGF